MNIIKKTFNTFQEAWESAKNEKEPTGVQSRYDKESNTYKYVTTVSDLTNTKTNEENHKA